jgi:hypothetical protein
MNYLRLLILLAILLLNGCARLNSIHRSTNIKSESKSIAVDAKQRFGFFSYNDQIKVCMEPSPDVFSAISSAFQGSLSKSDSLAASFKAAMSEGAGTIGIRTESIQLLRDAMYRLCEGFLNKAIQPDEFYQLHDRYQKSMITLVAVGALADTARPMQLTIGGSASITRNELILELKKALETAEKSKKEAEAQVTETNKALKTQTDEICKASEDSSITDITGIECENQDKREEQVTLFCSEEDNKGKAQCSSFNDLLSKRNEALNHQKLAIENIENIKRDLKDAEENPDIKTSSIVNWAKPSISQTTPENLAAVAGVVNTLVQQVYSHDLLDKCMSIAERQASSEWIEQTQKELFMNDYGISSHSLLDNSSGKITVAKIKALPKPNNNNNENRFNAGKNELIKAIEKSNTLKNLWQIMKCEELYKPITG